MSEPDDDFDILRHAPKGLPPSPAHARDLAITSLCQTAERVLVGWAKHKAGLTIVGTGPLHRSKMERERKAADAVRPNFSPDPGDRVVVNLPGVFIRQCSPDRYQVKVDDGGHLEVHLNRLTPEA